MHWSETEAWLVQEYLMQNKTRKQQKSYVLCMRNIFYKRANICVRLYKITLDQGKELRLGQEFICMCLNIHMSFLILLC